MSDDCCRRCFRPGHVAQADSTDPSQPAGTNCRRAGGQESGRPAPASVRTREGSVRIAAFDRDVLPFAMNHVITRVAAALAESVGENCGVIFCSYDDWAAAGFRGDVVVVPVMKPQVGSAGAFRAFTHPAERLGEASLSFRRAYLQPDRSIPRGILEVRIPPVPGPA